MANTEQLKEQIADTYIKDFKKELGFLEGTVLSFMHKKLVDLITSKEDVGETVKDIKGNWFLDKLISWFPETADKVYTYIKNKRIELQKATTSQELENLKAKIEGRPEPYPDLTVAPSAGDVQNTSSTDGNVSTDQDVGVSSVVVATTAAVTAAGVGTATGALVLRNSHEAIESTGDVLKTKASFGEYAKVLRDQLKNPKLSVLQKTNIENNAKVFEDAIKGVDAGTMDALAAWKTVGIDNLSPSLLKSMSLDSKGFESLHTILKDATLMDQLYAAKNVAEMQSILKVKKLSGLSDEVLSLIKSSHDIVNFKNMTIVLLNSKSLLQVSKAIFVASVFDLAFIGLDVYIRSETRKEADMIAKINDARARAMRNKATIHLIVGAASGLASAGLAISGLLASGPPGWVVLVGSIGIGAATAAIDYSLDASYFDIELFYSQNFEDDKKKLRFELKESLINVVKGIHAGTVAVNDPITVGLGGVLLSRALGYSIDKTVTDHIKFNSLQDLLKALIYIEQIDNNTFAMLKHVENQGLTIDKISTADKALFDQQKNTMDSMIDIRLPYLQSTMPQMKGDAKADVFLGGNGMVALESLLSKSRAAYDMGLSDAYVTGETNVDSYLSSYDTKLQKEDPVAYKKLSDLSTTNPIQYAVLYTGVCSYKSLVAGALTQDPNSVDYKKLDISIRYWESFEKLQSYKHRDESVVDTQTISYDDIDYKYLDEYLGLLSTNEIPKVSTWSQEEVFDILTQDMMHGYEIPVSENPFQNILYRIAREIYGANVSHDSLSLMSFYQESRDSILGIYYGNRRYEGSARRVINNDAAFDNSVDANDFATMSAEELMKKYFHMDMVDSAPENADKIINKELYARFSSIVKEELGYRVESRTQEVKQSIEDYIVKYATDGYIELPYNLSSQALRSGLGHVEKFVYTVRDGKIFAMVLGSNIDLPLGITVQKESTQRIRDVLRQDEQALVSDVDAALSQLNGLLSVEGTHTREDELDLTHEHEMMIRQKVKEWQDISHKLYYLQPFYAKQLLQSECKKYANFFSRMYTALLVEAGNNHVSNDVDKASDIQSVFNMVYGGFYSIESGVVKLHSSIKLPVGCDVYFEKIISTYKVADGRCIKDLLLSSSDRDKVLGSWYLEQLLHVLIGTYLLVKKNGKIVSINPGYSPYVDEKSNMIKPLSYDDLYTFFTQEVKSVPTSITLSNLAIPNNTTIYDSQTSVVSISGSDSRAIESAHDVTKTIESTHLDVVWQGRKEISFDHITGDVESRGYKTRIDAKNLKLLGLNAVVFKDIKELLWVANFVNRIKQYKSSHNKNKIYWGNRGFFGVGVDRGLFFADSGLDTQLIELDSLKHNSPSLMDAHNNLSAGFVTLLNTL